jgi:hypothetical protein
MGPSRISEAFRRRLTSASQTMSVWSARGRLFAGPSQRRHSLPAPLVVSLTSYPPRFAGLSATLAPLLVQSVKADRVVLWIAHGDIARLPSSVARLAGKGLEIRTTDDTGSYKKIIPALAAFSGAFIATADDDAYYDRRWLGDLIDGWDGRRDQIVFHRGHRIRLDERGLPLRYQEWTMCISGPQESVHNFPTGVGGVLYPPGSLAADVLDRRAFSTLCPNADDVWLYWMGRRAGAVYKKTGHRTNIAPNLKSNQDVSLWFGNMAGGNNDRSVARLIEAYGWPG